MSRAVEWSLSLIHDLYEASDEDDTLTVVDSATFRASTGGDWAEHVFRVEGMELELEKTYQVHGIPAFLWVLYRVDEANHRVQVLIGEVVYRTPEAAYAALSRFREEAGMEV